MIHNMPPRCEDDEWGPAGEWNEWQNEAITVPEGFRLQGFAPEPQQPPRRREKRRAARRQKRLPRVSQ